MSEEGADSPLSFFRSQLDFNRFDDATLRILESILVSRDVRSLIDVRSKLQGVLRSKAAPVLREISGKSVDEKLRIAQFFVRAFAITGDVESCLALKYEALLLRELKYANNPLLQVSFKEWLTFAEDSFDSGFYPIAIKGFNNALYLINSSNGGQLEDEISVGDGELAKKIKQYRDMALAFVASYSVQMQTAKYMNEKSNKQECGSCMNDARPSVSTVFRNAIRKRNLHKLHESQKTRLSAFAELNSKIFRRTHDNTAWGIPLNGLSLLFRHVQQDELHEASSSLFYPKK